MNLTIAIIGVAAAVAAAIAALGSWKAARKANNTATQMAGIERNRRHQELTPDFDVTCTTRDTSPDFADLRVVLKPGALQRLDEVIVTILDEAGKEHWTHGLPDGLTQEEAEMFVWGPWEFNKKPSAQVFSNRSTRSRAYDLTTGKNWDVLSLIRTRPGQWMAPKRGAGWNRQYAEQSLRLRITCYREGHEPWALLYEIKVERDGPFTI